MAINPFLFAHNPTIHFGAGRAEAVGAIVAGLGNTVLWVHGAASLVKSGAHKAIATSLRNAGLTVYEYEVRGEPSPQKVDAAVSTYKRHTVAVVLATGGGSVIDAGKAISAMLPIDEPVTDYLEGVGSKAHPGTKIPFVAVPTTAGTGCEATRNAVISNVGMHGFKRSLRHDNFMPDVAIVDPRLALSCPPEITAACGLDALTQLLESFLSTKASILTDLLAASGLECIKDNMIPASSSGAHDINIRTNMAYGALVSGITLANAGLGVVHGFASAIGGMFAVPHGVVCGTLLAPCMRQTIEKLAGSENGLPHLIKFAQAGEILCGMRGDTAEETCEMLVLKLESYPRAMAIPRLGQYGITASSVPAIVEETDNKNNPAKLDKADLRKILMERI
jgi:alcohol dehydrogenase class IV